VKTPPVVAFTSKRCSTSTDIGQVYKDSLGVQSKEDVGDWW
jgi:hypothetical protein